MFSETKKNQRDTSAARIFSLFVIKRITFNSSPTDKGSIRYKPLARVSINWTARVPNGPSWVGLWKLCCCTSQQHHPLPEQEPERKKAAVRTGKHPTQALHPHRCVRFGVVLDGLGIHVTCLIYGGLPCYNRVEGDLHPAPVYYLLVLLPSRKSIDFASFFLILLYSTKEDSNSTVTRWIDPAGFSTIKW